MNIKATQPTPHSPRQWIELRSPETHKLIGKYCPQTHQIEHVEKGRRVVIDLPVEKRGKAA